MHAPELLTGLILFAMYVVVSIALLNDTRAALQNNTMTLPRIGFSMLGSLAMSAVGCASILLIIIGCGIFPHT